MTYLLCFLDIVLFGFGIWVSATNHKVLSMLPLAVMAVILGRGPGTFVVLNCVLGLVLWQYDWIAVRFREPDFDPLRWLRYGDAKKESAPKRRTDSSLHESGLPKHTSHKPARTQHQHSGDKSV